MKVKRLVLNNNGLKVKKVSVEIFEYDVKRVEEELKDVFRSLEHPTIVQPSIIFRLIYPSKNWRSLSLKEKREWSSIVEYSLLKLSRKHPSIVFVTRAIRRYLVFPNKKMFFDYVIKNGIKVYALVNGKLFRYPEGK